MNILHQAGATYHPVYLGYFVCVKVLNMYISLSVIVVSSARG